MFDFNLSIEMKTLDLKDKRLNERCLNLLRTFEKNPEKSIPSACEAHAEIKAAYRFFKHEKVNADKILSPHIQSTIQRSKNQDTILYVEDTTELDFTDNSSLQSLNRLDHINRHGVYCHIALAIATSGTPLGVLSANFFDRDPSSFSHEKKYRHISLDEKESYRWVKGIRSANLLAKESPQTHIIYIADRESDTFHCLYEARKEETVCDVIIRAAKDRNTTSKIKGAEKKYKRLFQTLSEMPIQGEVTFETYSGHGKKSRLVTQTVQFGEVNLKPFRPQATGYTEIEINAIMLKEKSPPVGCKAVNWILLTTMSIGTLEEVMRIVQLYCMRWKIEVFFKILKVYCKIEELKLKDPSRIKTCTALYLIITWRLLLIQKIGELFPNEPCTKAFTELEWKVVYLCMLNKKKEGFEKLPKEAPKLKDFIRILAILGGFIGRKGDNVPGPKAICQGYSKMEALVEGWEICQKFHTYG